jgi:excisionase family DNA binding protein
VTVKPSGEGNVERLAYTPAEVAAAFGLSRKAIYRAIASGELQAARVCCGSRLLVPAEEARAWVARNLMVPAAPRRVRVEMSSRRAGRSTPLRDALDRRAA